MTLPRLQLFEFNDVDWAPKALRDTIVESLSRTLEWGHLLAGLVAPFEQFVSDAGVTEVLDVCAGAAGPARILCDEIRRAGRVPPRFWLTDLHPQLEAWEEARFHLPHDIHFVAHPVDATKIPLNVAAGRARVLINAFHHFPPALAQGILADAVDGSAGVFIAEAWDRNPLRFASFMPIGSLALAANPFLSTRNRLQKALLTFASPVVVAASLWDGLVSTMRTYQREELEAMVAPLGDRFVWTWGRHDGAGYYFYGVPRDARGIGVASASA
ncbi:MAG TPA: hypothetical protein VIA18_26640 [Polyangia bacterium]|jgi:hypothetical protein|nr:hypothetical protein [Polyangia bacterium]